MRPTTDAEAPKLCNNCILKEEQRNPRKEVVKMDCVEILIKCPRQDQIEIEEICINEGKDFTRYFLELHYASQTAKGLMKDQSNLSKLSEMDDKKEESKTKKMVKKS